MRALEQGGRNVSEDVLDVADNGFIDDEGRQSRMDGGRKRQNEESSFQKRGKDLFIIRTTKKCCQLKFGHSYTLKRSVDPRILGENETPEGVWEEEGTEL